MFALLFAFSLLTSTIVEDVPILDSDLLIEESLDVENDGGEVINEDNNDVVSSDSNIVEREVIIQNIDTSEITDKMDLLDSKMALMTTLLGSDSGSSDSETVNCFTLEEMTYHTVAPNVFCEYNAIDGVSQIAIIYNQSDSNLTFYYGYKSTEWAVTSSSNSYSGSGTYTCVVSPHSYVAVTSHDTVNSPHLVIRTSVAQSVKMVLYRATYTTLEIGGSGSSGGDVSGSDPSTSGDLLTAINNSNVLLATSVTSFNNIIEWLKVIISVTVLFWSLPKIRDFVKCISLRKGEKK